VAKGIHELAIPASANVGSRYYIASLQGQNNDLAKQFVSFVMSDQAEKILADRGFKMP
jgi:ABC-type molybdate transport system substrate-binding protein